MPIRTTLLIAALLIAGSIRPWDAAPAAAATPLASNPIKLAVTQEGLYRLTYAYLQSQGVDPSNVTVATLGLSDGGSAVPIYVSSASSTFSPGDYIEFYGHPVNNTYNTTNVYILSDGVSSPARVASATVAASSAPVSVGSTVYYDPQRTIHWTRAPVPAAYTTDDSWPSDGDPHWAELVLTPSSSSPTQSQPVTFSLTNLATSGSLPCSITMPVTGVPVQSTAANPVHQVALTITNSGIDHPLPHSPYTWQSPSPGTDASYTISDTFPCSWLVNTTGSPNPLTLSVSTTLQSGTTQEEILPQAFHIGYGENLQAQNNQLQWQGPASGPSGDYSATGFTTPPVSLWRFSAGTLTRLTGFTAGANSLAFSDTPGTSATYYASAAPLTPASVTPLDQSDITSGGSTSAQYLIITHPLFQSSLGSLIAYHQSQGLTVKVVSVTTIYDQYGNGQVNPEAIRSYITYAQQHLGTQYVLLVGADTYDYHNYYGCPASGKCAATNPSNLSFIPSLYVKSTYDGIVSSDNLLAVPTGAGNNAPAVAIGRMPVTSVAQLGTVITRSINWPAWASAYAGTGAFGAGFEDPTFQPASDTMIANGPPGMRATRYYEDGVYADDETNRNNFIAAFDAGREIINYVGHGNLVQWSKHPMFQVADVARLTNSNRPAFVLQWGCQTADYTEPLAADIDVSMLTATDAGGNPTGAALTVGSTGTDLPVPQAVLAGGETETGPTGVHYFFGYLTQGMSAGLALQRAKDDLMQLHGGDPNFVDVVNSYEILGDPALALQDPIPPTIPTSPGPYHALPPARILDTRFSGQTLRPNSSLTFLVAGQGGVPSSGVTAVVLNVTATNTTTGSWLAVYPAGLGVPNASNLNWVAGQTVPNLVEVAVAKTGQVSVYNPLGNVDVVVDVEGYVSSSASGTAGLYNPLVPARILDTRPGSGQQGAGQTLQPNTALTFQVTGQGNVPGTGVKAVVLNVTVTDTTANGWLAVYPAGQGTPNASNLNWSAGETRPNRVIVPVGTNGEVTVYSPLGSVDVVVDVGGYFTDGSNPSATGSLFSATSPARITDTRPGSGQINAGQTLGPGGVLGVQVAGVGGVPSMSSGTPPRAVVLNVTVTNPTSNGWIVAYPSSSGVPNSSDLNYSRGETIPNLVVVKLGPDGKIDVFNCCGSVDVVIDVTGWYA